MSRKKKKRKGQQGPAGDDSEEPKGPPKDAEQKSRWLDRFSPGEKLLAAVGIAGGIVVLYQTQVGEWQFRRQHKPEMVFASLPRLTMPITCDSATGILEFTAIWSYKNVGDRQANIVLAPHINARAAHADEDLGHLVRPESCKHKFNSAKELFSPIAPGDARSIPVTHTYTHPGTPFATNERIKLMVSGCLEYRDEYGGDHLTCNSFGLVSPTHVYSGGGTTFACDTEFIGVFVNNITGNCSE